MMQCQFVYNHKGRTKDMNFYFYNIITLIIYGIKTKFD